MMRVLVSVFLGLVLISAFLTGCLGKVLPKNEPLGHVTPIATPEYRPRTDWGGASFFDSRENSLVAAIQKQASKSNIRLTVDLISLVVAETRKNAQTLQMGERHVLDMLALWWVESRFKNVTGDDGKSVGITQVHRKNLKRLTQEWAAMGKKVPEGVKGQIALGVMAYWKCLQQAKGDRFDAVRRYNGGNAGSKSMKKALRHAAKVSKARKAIFGSEIPKIDF